MHTIPDSNGRRLLLTRLLCGGLLASGSWTAHAGTPRLWQIHEFTRVELVLRENGSAPNQHPVQLSVEALREQLARVRFTSPNGIQPLFASDELDDVVKPLVRAFELAGPGDDVAIASSSRRDSGVLSSPTAVTARLFFEGGQLQLIVHDTRQDFYDAYRGRQAMPRFVYGSRTDASPITLQAPGATSRRSDWLALSATPVPAANAPQSQPTALPAGAVDSAEQRLEVLKRLRDKNLITEDEYQQKRKAILQLL